MNNDKIISIEFGRVVAILAIVAMHCQMFLTYWQFDGTPWLGFIFNQTTRFAVPLFFLISGYLIQPKLIVDPISTLKQYLTPLLRIFVVWSIICLLMPFNLQRVAEQGYLAEREGYWQFLAATPLNSVLEGGLVHLWFIPALMFAALIAGVLAKLNKTTWLLPIGAILYVYGVLGGSYQNLTELWTPFFTRNGPFFSSLLFAIGFAIRQHSISVSARHAALLAFVGMMIHFGEAAWLYQFDQPFNANDFLFGTVLWGTGCFLWLLAKPELGKDRRITSLSKFVLPIYVTHLPVIILMMNVARYYEITDLAKDGLALFGTLITTLILVVGLSKTPLYRWLFR
ncbi:fucose 4-O-acetylase [Vibrio caribbeanicus]|uniref:Fucose 4-O-acetylase n=1 Tax=Vibrio caribbeanicus TaxID=701175 RepID=A0ACC4NZR4_9VIBR|nr:acyltransferase family protein [Vibrio caribbeanicus]KHD26200.1 fucose 4-O-acetylase [Vibrio caribbeanicus]